MIRVYQFGCKGPVEGESVQRAQVRAAHDYRNDLVAVERGRRHALRAILDTPEVRDAEASLKAATKSTRKAALTALSKIRRETLDAARCAGGHWEAPVEWNEGDGRRRQLRYAYSPLYETGRIALLDKSIRGDARHLTETFWGSYLTIEASSDQVRRMPLYEGGGLEPSDPKFVRAEETRIGSGVYVGQIGIQIQGGLATRDVLAGTDPRVRLAPDRFADRKQTGHPWRVLWLRVGSEGRDPVWAKFPVRMHRQVPDAARWKWVRVSCRREATHAVWSCEITVDDPAPAARSLDRSLEGAVALEVEWTPVAGTIRVGTWRDHEGRTGEVMLSEREIKGICKSADIRAVRDLIRNDMAPKLARAMTGPLPPELAKAKATMHLWLSLDRFHRLYESWSAKHATCCPKALAMLAEWVHRDRHLWQYADGSRGQALRRRREQYRVLAAEWGRRYRTVILEDRDLSREARFGEESDVRFVAGPSELRGALRLVFGADAIEHPWIPAARLSESEERSWCERAIDAWIGGGARTEENVSGSGTLRGNAWERRKEKKRAKSEEIASARESAAKVAE
jgi:hypothetical protein